MRFLRLFVIVVLLLSFSCAKPEYLVKGVTLPPGSTVASRKESKETAGAQADNVSSIVVAFDNPGGWQAVSAHFDQQLKGLGFVAEEQPDMGGLEKQYPNMNKMMKSMRIYNHEGKGYGVVVQDMADVLGKAMDKLKKSGGSEEIGQFMLMVTTPN